METVTNWPTPFWESLESCIDDGEAGNEDGSRRTGTLVRSKLIDVFGNLPNCWEKNPSATGSATGSEGSEMAEGVVTIGGGK